MKPIHTVVTVAEPYIAGVFQKGDVVQIGERRVYLIAVDDANGVLTVRDLPLPWYLRLMHWLDRTIRRLWKA